MLKTGHSRRFLHTETAGGGVGEDGTSLVVAKVSAPGERRTESGCLSPEGASCLQRKDREPLGQLPALSSGSLPPCRSFPTEARAWEPFMWLVWVSPGAESRVESRCEG